MSNRISMKGTEMSEINLFGLEEPVSFKDAPADLPSPFRYWMARMERQGGLDPLVRALVRAGEVKSPQEAFEYLAKVSEEFRGRKHIARADFKGESLKVLRRLNIQLAGEDGDEKSSNETLYRVHGIAGHVAIPRLVSLLSERHTIPGESFKQGKMFEIEELKEEQISLPFSGGGQNALLKQRRAPKIFRLSEEFVKRLRTHWETAKASVDGDKWFDRYRRLKPSQNRLQRMLVRVFGEEVVRQVSKYRGPLADYLTQLTLMSWASAVIYHFERGERIIFREVPVLAHRYGVNGGRLDALELVSIDGQPLDLPELKVFASMVRRYEKEGGWSAGQIVADLERLFPGKILEFDVLDWKFAVGDSPDVSKVVEVADIREKPFQKHADQVMRYLTLASVDYHLARQKSDVSWQEGKHFRKGILVYFFPLAEPILHEISATPEDKDKFFTEKIVQIFHRANERANFRILSNFLVGHAISVLRNGGNGYPRRARGRNGVEQVTLFNGDDVSRFERIVQGRRRFADEFEMFEIVGSRSDESTLMLFHFDNLKAAVESGKTPVASQFTWERGGKVLCPLHDDSNPSLHIYVERRFAKCFACGAFARFSDEGLMHVLPHLVLESSRFVKPNPTLQNLKIPSRHLDVMGLAGVFLNTALLGSAGEEYLAKERRLNPDIAKATGVGFCDDRIFFNDLLDAGISFEEMVHYGFVGFSERLKLERSLAPIFLDRGLALTDIKKAIPLRKGPAEALPYSILGGRITFPLSIDGRWVSFYGRDVMNRGKSFAHRKLIVSDSNVPHGIFNEEPLFSDASEVTLVEGPIDALTLIEMGYKETSAIVGVKNFVVLELVARAEKNVAIGLDNDEGGRDNTYGIIKETPYGAGKTRKVKIVGLIEWFEKRGFQGRVRDFTAEFKAQNGGGWDDWNSWFKMQKQAHG